MEQADLVAAIHDMQVSGNRATPKSSSFMRFSLAETIQLLGYGTIQISGGVNGTFWPMAPLAVSPFKMIKSNYIGSTDHEFCAIYGQKIVRFTYT